MKNKILKLLTLLFLIIHLTSIKIYAQCAIPSNIYQFTYSGKNYEIIKENKTWAQASQCAVERGGFLVHIDSLPEQNAIYSAIVSSGISTTYKPVNDGGGTSYIWIGATDKNIEGTWLWDGDNNNSGINFWNGQGAAGSGGGSTVSGNYVNWGGTSTGTIQEPDNYANNQDAAAIALTGWPYGTTNLGIAGEWNDINITNSIYYIVEYNGSTGLNDTKNQGTNFLLSQNYPNPFNPSTTIKYQLASQSYVKLIITNILGETVSILEDGLKDAGNHKSIFNARNLTSGIYYYQIIAGDYRETKKMILIR